MPWPRRGARRTGHGFTPASLNFATTYYWKVDEVGDAGTYAGDVWSFTTQEYAAIDDFEGYNDDDNRIYETWIDGLTTPPRAARRSDMMSRRLPRRRSFTAASSPCP